MFTGREYDWETGLYNYRNRMYDPAIGRFTTEDPIGFNGGDLNLYRYVGNSPQMFRDPMGLFMDLFMNNPMGRAALSGGSPAPFLINPSYSGGDPLPMTRGHRRGLLSGATAGMDIFFLPPFEASNPREQEDYNQGLLTGGMLALGIGSIPFVGGGLMFGGFTAILYRWNCFGRNTGRPGSVSNLDLVFGLGGNLPLGELGAPLLGMIGRGVRPRLDFLDNFDGWYGTPGAQEFGDLIPEQAWEAAQRVRERGHMTGREWGAITDASTGEIIHRPWTNRNIADGDTLQHSPQQLISVPGNDAIHSHADYLDEANFIASSNVGHSGQDFAFGIQHKPRSVIVVTPDYDYIFDPNIPAGLITQALSGNRFTVDGYRIPRIMQDQIDQVAISGLFPSGYPSPEGVLRINIDIVSRYGGRYGVRRARNPMK